MAKRKRSQAAAQPSKQPRIASKRKRAEVKTKECVICSETMPLYRNFPTFSTCSHDPETCSSCLAQQCVTILEGSQDKGWSVCRCPQCNVPIPTEELQGALPRTLVKEIKEMVSKSLESADESWRWCLAQGCGHGSLQNGRNEMIRCRKCGFKTCFKHQVPWHADYTCEEYETFHPQAKITKTNEEMIMKMSKPCPGCGIAVQKVGGCNHMHCAKCGKYWNWESIHLSREFGGPPVQVAGGFPGPAPASQNTVFPPPYPQFPNFGQTATTNSATRQSALEPGGMLMPPEGPHEGSPQQFLPEAGRNVQPAQAEAHQALPQQLAAAARRHRQEEISRVTITMDDLGTIVDPSELELGFWTINSRDLQWDLAGGVIRRPLSVEIGTAGNLSRARGS